MSWEVVAQHGAYRNRATTAFHIGGERAKEAVVLSSACRRHIKVAHVKSYHLPLEYHDSLSTLVSIIPVATFFSRGPRTPSLQLWSRWHTNEFTIAFEDKKPQGVLKHGRRERRA